MGMAGGTFETVVAFLKLPSSETKVSLSANQSPFQKRSKEQWLPYFRQDCVCWEPARSSNQYTANTTALLLKVQSLFPRPEAHVNRLVSSLVDKSTKQVRVVFVASRKKTSRWRRLRRLTSFLFVAAPVEFCAQLVPAQKATKKTNWWREPRKCSGFWGGRRRKWNYALKEEDANEDQKFDVPLQEVPQQGTSSGQSIQILPSHIEMFHRIFETYPEPSQELLQNLSSISGLSADLIEEWFRNQRSQ
ncbi:hypothetical protein CAEBREN_30846 [Caenorhabditis brenneri]|uniref:Homeobox domain-containing protein n=1 Tax=Caenorhabditis brenneri TaxID=135651 RepID=G0PD41_CAEBE|nr:hypothetical protein CAEBREN_30846 [Caenorhabditis brenneri]